MNALSKQIKITVNICKFFCVQKEYELNVKLEADNVLNKTRLDTVTNFQKAPLVFL